MSLILIYVGHFLFTGESRQNGGELDGKTPEQTKTVPPDAASIHRAEDAVKYIHKSETLDGLNQEINILEIDPGAQGIKIMPVLSHDLIYGFEKLSAMAGRKNAYAAVNGGFFHVDGLPSGMVVIDGELISASTGKYPVLIIEGGKAALREIDDRLTVEYTREAGTVAVYGRLTVDNMNVPAKNRQTIVYTPVYGRSNRAKARNITATVVNGVVTRIADYPGEAEIPENGLLISFFDTLGYAGKELPIRDGDRVKLLGSAKIGADTQAYECGSWIVRNGTPVVKEKDAWVGVMTNRDPRTAVGIKADGTVVLITVDGRQPGYSEGFTGLELANYMITLGVKDAAMLDGGASTEMLLKGRLVNRPSYGGEERELAGGLLVLADNFAQK